ncbi:uncharacterized protein LOC113281015 [Papaver somniferum]|uniref:uncharacterized protein LOC113281015 n=1 Tax=Papaver somniferum TaxID=3469 RepID=UPI000E6FB82E|nr:uncharacterized protein LOC113281015 [Papaver somniferum]
MKKKNNNKGKIYPSPSPHSSSSPCSSISRYDFGPHRDALSVFKVLPVTILTLASLLTLEDREVLAYLITRSIITTETTNPEADSSKNNNKKKKKHKSPDFECGCFECYTSYWYRWDLSPNRQLIHQAIEAFEEHLTNLEIVKNSSTSGKKKRADKMGSRVKGKISSIDDEKQSISYTQSPLPVKSLFHTDDFGNEAVEEEVVVEEEKGLLVEDLISSGGGGGGDETGEMVLVVMKKKNSEEQEYKGLVRKVLPDVLGLFNSRLWNLIWSPNV